MLQKNIVELKDNYLKIINSEEFQNEFHSLLKDYAGRPTALYYAKRLSELYENDIYLKREDLTHTGAHKINNAIGQILLARKLGKKRIIAETGAGQHGVATATVCALFGMECIVYMGELDTQRQEPNVRRMQMLGAKVVPVTSGSRVLKDATNEAIRDWIANPVDTHYIIGSVVGPHPFPDMVAKFQSVIGYETLSQLEEKTGSENPDYIIACVGGGSNAIGIFYPYLDREQVNLIAVEAAGEGANTSRTAASTVVGKPGILHASKTLFMQDDDGQVEEAYSVSAGLDYPGIGPQHAHLFTSKRVKYVNVTDTDALTSAFQLSKIEGIIPALETAHAFAYLEKFEDKNKTIVLNLSGRGDKDMGTYLKYF
ncbi:UNVERIFIED_CONTAM: hypothetical protein GTU68_066429 [Idotea baltica]|nr:hypothetical protein [Idotea baltica]